MTYRHGSLVAFTLLVQTAVGSVWCIGAALLLSGSRFSLLHCEWHALFALLMVLAGLAASIAHLGRPGVCFYAIRNLRRSWLSREVAATGAFAGILAVMVLTCAWSGELNGWVVLVESLVGGLVLYVMVRAYRLRTVPSWNHAGTVLGFLGSALLLGGLQFTVVSDALMGGFHGTSGADFLPSMGLLVALAGFIFKVQGQGRSFSQMAKSRMSFSFSQPVLQGSGLVLWAISVVSGGSISLEWTFLSLAAAGLVIGEIVHRIRFYDAYHSAGL